MFQGDCSVSLTIFTPLNTSGLAVLKSLNFLAPLETPQIVSIFFAITSVLTLLPYRFLET